MDQERPPALWRGMWFRFALAGLLIVALSGGATATFVLTEGEGIAKEVFPELSRIKEIPPNLLSKGYEGKPENFLVLGSDRRSGSKNSEERNATPHSDTILLVRFDPEQGQTSVMSIPRDLMVNIRTPQGQLYTNEKINAAYTIGSKLKGGGTVLAAETIEREVFPELKGHLNGIIDVNFAGFIKVVDTLGCAYVNVDHRYLGGGALGENFSSINLQPGYQRLCYNSALSYVRFRHYDSDFVRVARQQDFMRALREQVSPEDVLGKVHQVAKAVGKAIKTNFKASFDTLKLLSTLIAFSQTKPLRQVKFRTANVNAQFGGGSFVTSTPELEKATLNDFLHGRQTVKVRSSGPPRHSSKRHGSSSGSTASSAALGLIATTGESEAVKAALKVPMKVLYPTLQTAVSSQETVRPYYLRNQQNQLRHAYVVVFRQNTLGGYYDFQGSDWTNPPLFANARRQTIGGRSYLLVDDGSHIHVLGWKSGGALYWVTNTLLEDLSNSQMLAIAKSAQKLK
ncbi:MAG: polyisoprenyl-teichoic acid--peptidoglycan teichoic acid transferase [Solirubrobacteraceae bacterium]|nr:polyisoprenyl-teichoic acid--peptidoglycan teichoic acid transferase [Solirubrobacteraceae bacterium]